MRIEWNFVARAIRGNDLEPNAFSRYQDRAFARCAGRMARATDVFRFFLTTRVSAVMDKRKS